MLKLVKQLLISFFNYSGLFCFQLKNGKFEISNFKAATNLFKMLFSYVLTILITQVYRGKYEIFRVNIVAFPNFSVFSKIVLIASGVLITHTGIVLTIVHFGKRHAFRNLLNEALSCNLKPAYLIRFEKACFRSFAAIGVLIPTIMFLRFYSLMYLTALNFLIFLVFVYPFILLLGFICFVKIFEKFIVTSLEEIDEDLKNIRNHDRQLGFENFLMLSKKYQKLHDLAENFNTAFGSQVTVMTSLIIGTSVCNVSA